MAKSSKPKKNGADTTAAYSKKSKDNLQPAKDNPAKFQPTEDAELDIATLDSADGIQKLFTDNIKDIYWAENHLTMALPKMAKATSVKSLQTAILNHLEETKVHVERLEQVFEMMGKTPQAKKCDAMEGLIKEGEATIESTDTASPARNLGIILSSQKVEHYEIASYSGLIKLATSLGMTEVVSLLNETLAEEENSDQLLAEIADEEMLNADMNPGNLGDDDTE